MNRLTAQDIVLRELIHESSKGHALKLAKHFKQAVYQARRENVAIRHADRGHRGEVGPRLIDHRVGLATESQIETDADHRMTWPECVAAQLNQDTGQLAPIDLHIIRPFQAKPGVAEISECAHDADANREAEASQGRHARIEGM